MLSKMFFVLLMVTVATESIYINQTPKQPKSTSSDHEEGIGTNFSKHTKQLEDEEVRELENLKPSSGVIQKTQKEKYDDDDNENGKREHNFMNEKVSKSKEHVEHFKPEAASKSINLAPVMSEIQFPREDDIRDKFQMKIGSGDETEFINEQDKLRLLRLLHGASSKFADTVDLYSPYEMASYIFETGDEETVTDIIAHYLRNSLLNRKSVLSYLQDIQTILHDLRNTDEKVNDIKQDYDNDFDKVLYPNYVSEDEITDFNGLQKVLQANEMRRFPTNGPTHKSKRNQLEDNDILYPNLMEIDNTELLVKNENVAANEKSEAFENLFFESSLEEVIYELGKALFEQSLSMGGNNARDTMDRFTLFLETQVVEGHISRHMEKKVLDILTSALADILNDEIEAFNLVKESYAEGNNVPLKDIDRIKLEKKDGSGSSHGKYTMMLKSAEKSSLNAANKKHF